VLLLDVAITNVMRPPIRTIGIRIQSQYSRRSSFMAST
tara:strand:- start:3400 stop:3513 length:114 start_codon:yes stop_codon:yes gene_type:complete